MLVLILLSGAVAYQIFRAGGVIPVDSYAAAVSLAMVSLVGVVIAIRSKPLPEMPRLLSWPLFLFPAYLAFQLIPLPFVMVRAIAPARAAIHDALANVIPSIGFTAISVIPATTALHLVQAINCVLIFLLVRQAACRLGERAWLASLPLVVIGVAEAADGVMQAGAASVTVPAAGTYVNHNHFAGLLEMILPFAVLYPVSLLSRKEGRKASMSRLLGACVFMGSAGLMLGAILVCLSRMGLIAALVGLCVCGAGMALCSGWMRGMKSASRFGILAGAGLLFVLAGFLFLPPDQMVSRFGTSDIRTEIWSESLPLVRSYWLLGCGSGGYESVFMKYKHTDPMFRIDYAHNDYLQRVIEWGAIGCLLAGAWMAAVLFQARRAARRHPALSGRALAVACIAAIAAILVHSLVDFNLYIPANAMVLSWICGIAVCMPLSSRSVRVSRSHARMSYAGGPVVDVPN